MKKKGIKYISVMAIVGAICGVTLYNRNKKTKIVVKNEELKKPMVYHKIATLVKNNKGFHSKSINENK